eukprot:2102015-Pyramimonas_sp.AAC.1
MVCSLRGTLSIPAVLENPSTSSLWSLPGARALARSYNARDVDVDFCASGTSWRKRIRLRFCHLELSGLEEARCQGRGLFVLQVPSYGARGQGSF